MQLKLTNTDLCAEIDAEALPLLLQHADSFFISYRKCGKIRGVYCNSRIYGKTVGIYRIIINYTGSLVVDHIDRNPLNNRKDNLRITTISDNCANTTLDRTKMTSNFRGVSWSKKAKKWKASVFYRGVSYHAGYFDCEAKAAAASDNLRQELRGSVAQLNIN